MKPVLFALAWLLLLVAGVPVQAQDLRIALGSAGTSADPHFTVLGSNSALARNIFDGLVNQDDNQQLTPALAVSWRPLDATTWEFKLRTGVRFHDGSPFEAEDVAASIRRIAIVPRAVEQAGQEAFNAAQSAHGTGPYRLVEYVPGERIVLRRNEQHWGGMPRWASVTMRIVPNDSARITALLETFTPAKGMGSGNRGRFSNARLDAAMAEALASVEDANREKLLREATRVCIREHGVIPLFFLVNTWATRAGLGFAPRSDGYTLAENARR